MKTNKKNLQPQRKILERKVQPWLVLRTDRVPPSGWLKAIRGALGITTRQLAERLGVQHTAIVQFEKNEAEGKVSLETIHKLARAMRCQFIYAVVPESPFGNLEEILDAQATLAARAIISRVDHTMRLEQQGISPERSSEQVQELAAKLKVDMDPTLWSEPRSVLGRKKSK